MAIILDTRFNLLKQWLNSVVNTPILSIEPASEDASFRRYFRVTIKAADNNSSTLIAMDAPPEHEDNPKFVLCAETLLDCGLIAPEIITKNFDDGFLLVSDLGVTTYQEGLKTKDDVTLYKAAIDALINLQMGTVNHQHKHPAYDGSLLSSEMGLFEEWYVNKHLGTKLSNDQKTVLTQTFNCLIDNATSQPQVLVHRDYHCRNLLTTDSSSQPGVIDFQDMVVGAATYDLVSLLKDCYIEWPNNFINSMLEYYLQQVEEKALFTEQPAFEQLRKWFDLMGVQRHLKVLGIFARLNYRDNKDQYLNDLPLVRKYVVETCKQYDELQPLGSLMSQLGE